MRTNNSNNLRKNRILAAVVGLGLAGGFLAMPSSSANAGFDLKGLINVPGGRVSVNPIEIIDWFQKQQSKEWEASQKQGVPIAMLKEMISEASTRVATTLPKVKEIKQSEGRKLLAIGGFKNETASPSAVFDMAMEAIQSQLSENEAINQSFDVIGSDDADADDILKKVQGGKKSTGPEAKEDNHYEPQDIYVMLGRFYEISENMDSPKNALRSYRLLVQIKHPESRNRLIKSYEFSRDYRWSNQDKKWVLSNS